MTISIETIFKTREIAFKTRSHAIRQLAGSTPYKISGLLGAHLAYSLVWRILCKWGAEKISA